jgi:hypothetical protein
MQIRLVSSLTSEDEARIAAAICCVVSGLLDQFDIAYTLRIETTDGQLFHETACHDVQPVISDVATT